MRYIFRLLLLAGLSFTISALYASETDTLGFVGFKAPKMDYKQNLIKTSWVPLLIGQIPYCGELRFTYERMLTHNQSLTGGISYNYPNLFLLLVSIKMAHPKFSDYSYRGVRATLGYRYYPLKDWDAPEGLFIGPYFSYNYVKIQEKKGNGSYETMNYLNADFIAGFQHDIGGNFYFEIFGGLGYRNNFYFDYDARNQKTSSSYNNFLGAPKWLLALSHVKVVMQINFAYAF